MRPLFAHLPARLVFACLLALACQLLPAVDMADKMNDSPDESELERDYFRDYEQKAAKYRLGRANATAEEKDDVDAKKYLDEARKLLADGHGRWARKKALKGFKLHPYSTFAGDLQHVAVLGYAKKGDLTGVRDCLVTLWLSFPEHPDMQEAMQVALDAGERAQRFTSLIHLEADDPADTIDVSGEGWRDENNRLFRFLARNGDRATIAPRAQLGLARSLLLSEDRSKGFPNVRAAYEKFLDDYPDHELTFTALCELALAHLRTYRGEYFDLGALDHASSVIDQAEVETRGDAVRAKTVQDYRRRIRSWLQDRDFQVATWYMRRCHPPFGLIMGTAKPDAARIYYQQVVDRDPGSKKARLAQRALAEMGPAATPAYERDLLPEAARP